MELDVGKARHDSARQSVSQVKFGMTMSGKARKDGAWHKKIK